jgi:hypothetical protein
MYGTAARQWLLRGALIVGCGALVFAWYRQIESANSALCDQMRNTLQAKLNRVRLDFNADVAEAVNGLLPPGSFTDAEALESAMVKHLGPDLRIFRRIAIAIPGEYLITLRMFDTSKRRFAYREWPEQWRSMYAELTTIHYRAGPVTPAKGLVFERPVFSPWPGREIAWIVFELNLDDLRHRLLPEVLQHDLGPEVIKDYRLEVATVSWDVTKVGPVIYKSGPARRSIGGRFDAYVYLLQPQFIACDGRRWHRTGEIRFGSETSRWILQVGGLDAAVARHRRREWGIGAGLLSLAMAGGLAWSTVARRTAGERLTAID